MYLGKKMSTHQIPPANNLTTAESDGLAIGVATLSLFQTLQTDGAKADSSDGLFYSAPGATSEEESALSVVFSDHGDLVCELAAAPGPGGDAGLAEECPCG